MSGVLCMIVKHELHTKTRHCKVQTRQAAILRQVSGEGTLVLIEWLSGAHLSQSDAAHAFAAAMLPAEGGTPLQDTVM